MGVPLTKRGRDILEFEGAWWKEVGSKEAAIRERFELSTTRYYQLLSELLEDEDALREYPLVVRRLRRVRQQRRQARYESKAWGRPPRR